MSNFSYEIGSDNIAIIKWDVPDKKFNVLTLEGISEIENILEKIFENLGVQKGNPNINLCAGSAETFQNATAVIILTEWDEFKSIDFKKICKNFCKKTLKNQNLRR